MKMIFCNIVYCILGLAFAIPVFGQSDDEANYIKVLSPYYMDKKIILLTNLEKCFPWDKSGVSQCLASGRITDQCFTDLYIWKSGVEAWQEWATKINDAQGVPGSGIFDGNYHMLGSFDQCHSVAPSNTPVILPDGTTKTHDFNTKYCRAYTRLYAADRYQSLGLCVPESCSQTDVNLILNDNGTHVPPDPTLTFCYEELNFWADPSAIVAFVIVLIFLSLVLAGSLLDYIKYQKSSCCKVEEENLKNVEGGTKQSYTVNEDVRTKQGNNDNGVYVVEQQGAHGTPGAVQDGPLQSEIEVQTPQPGIPAQLLLSFSLWKNFPAVTSANPGTRGFLCLNGLRVLSFVWIVLHHTWFLGNVVGGYAQTYNLANYEMYMETHYTNWFHMVIKNGSLAVETFFFLSGLLVTMSLMRTLDRQGGRPNCKQMALYYFHRYWRLTPVYMFLIMMFACFYPYLVNGPTPPEFKEVAACKTSFWTNLFYVNTIVYPEEGMCIGWSWYMADDMIYYVIAPIVIIPLVRYPKCGWAIASIFYIVFVAVMVISAIFMWDFWGLLYFPPHTRGAPYFLGVIVGAGLYKRDCKVPMKWWAVTIGWIAAFAAILVGIFIENFAISHTAFPLGIAWIAFACMTGYGGPINAFLSWKFWIPLSRLTYVGYLIHPIVIYNQRHNSMVPIYINENMMAYTFVGFLGFTLFLSLLVTLVFEVPFLELEKVFFPKKKKN